MGATTRHEVRTTGAAARPGWSLLVASSVILFVVHLAGTHATAWHFFHDAGRLLLGDVGPGEVGGLRLYRDHPELQFGPLSVVLAAPFTVLGERGGSWAAMAVASALGLAAFACVVATLDALAVRCSRRALTAGGLVFVAVWGDVAVRTTHIDDAFALAAAAFAVLAWARHRGLVAAVAIGLAAAAKPWAITFAPLVLVARPRARPADVVRAAGVIGLIVAAAWAPFVIAEPETLDVSRFAIDNDPTSTLRALGIHATETPAWARPVQLAGGFAIAALVVARGRAHAMLLAAVSWRLLFEPGAHRYYTAGAVLGALLVELVARPRRVPWCTFALAVLLEVTAVPGSHVVLRRTLRLATVVAGLGAALLAPALSPAGGRSPARAPSSSSSNDP